MSKFKDYTNTTIINNYGEKIKILSLDGKNSSGTYKWFYECVYCKKPSSDTISNIKKSKGCKNCRQERSSNSRKISENMLIERINNIDKNFLLVGKYINNSTPIDFWCQKHRLIFKAIPANIFSNKTIKCPKCLKELKQSCFQIYSKDDIHAILYDNNYVWLNEEDYVNASSVLEYKCTKCGNISKSNITNIINGRSCGVCRGLCLKTTDEFKEDVYALTGDEYSVLGEYIGNKKHVLMRHNICNNTWNAIPTNFLYRNRRCPYCKSSRGEDEVSEFLSEHKIAFKREHSFNGCVYINKLRFDFYLPKHNAVIEFQGKQHYEPNSYMGGQKDFELRQVRDDIKRKYCKENNICLLEIRYDEIDSIKEILTDFLERNSCIKGVTNNKYE